MGKLGLTWRSAAGSRSPPIGLVLNGDTASITIQPILILPTIPLSIHQTVNFWARWWFPTQTSAFGGGIGIPTSAR